MICYENIVNIVPLLFLSLELFDTSIIEVGEFKS